MSIRVMSDIWDNGPKDKSEILILLALADYSNDAGECWPAMASIALKARMSERGAQKIVARLIETGWLEVEIGGGRRNCNLYRIKNPELGSPRTTFTPNVVTETPNTVPKNPEPRSPEPSMNHHEPSVINEGREIRSILCECASDAAATSFIAYRRKQKGKSLTVTAATRLAKQLRDITALGGDADDALGLAEERGWQSVQSDWYFKAKGNGNDNRNSKQRPTSTGQQDRSDPALENIFRLAGLSQASGNGGR